MVTSIRRDVLITLRKNKGWLQKDVVEKLKNDYNIIISESYYGMIEQGVRTPSLKVAHAISELFGVITTKIFLNTNTTKCCF
ncbi:helix-turn-helix transcriptional regulator [Lysinibacillus macroides]|uniref:helix-turn-helix transcriptional regulator n=1 Tax=Lysinibacillus macroides TaxID=33935 RepID=UPI0006B5F1AB|nr:helix-turn-helix transcriptional regulator [Lysinibacillus macroides]